jgi:phage baseplate assembly protein W
MSDIDTIPKISFPFRLHPNLESAVYVEQDSDDEILDSVEIILSTEQGRIEEVPTFGIPDLTFVQGGVNPRVLQEAISRWEPRARDRIRPETIEDLVQHVTIEVVERGR